MADVTLIMRADNSDHIRKIKEVQQAHQNLNKTVVANQQREKGLIEDIEDALTELQAAKKKAYSVEEITRYNQKIAEAKRDLEDYNNAGLKVEKTQQSMIQSIGKWVAGLGLLTTLLNSLKNTFRDTVTGMNLMTQAGELWAQMTYNLVTVNTTLNTSLAQSIAIGKQINALRKDERKDMVEVSKLQRQYNELYFAASDRRRGDVERVQLLDQALMVHNLMVETEIKNLNEQKSIIIQQLAIRPKSNKLLDEEAKLEKALQQAESSRWSETKRIEALRTGMIQEGIDNAKKDEEDKQKAIKTIRDKAADDELRESLRDQKYATDLLVAYEKEQTKKREEAKKNVQLNFYDKWKLWSLDKVKEVGKSIDDAEDRIRRERERKEAESEQKKVDAKRQAWDTIIAGEQAVFNILAINSDNNLNRELQALDKKTQAELRAAGDNEKKKQAILDKSEAEKLNIEKKYRKEQQKISVAQTLISGAQAIVKTFAEYGYTPPGWVAAGLMAALTALQVGVIKAQKFAKGGWTGKGGQRDETGERIAGIVHEEEFVTKRGPAAKYREVLEAINRDDRRAMINSFNKIDIPDIMAPQVNNSIRVDNRGPNSRLDRVIQEQRKLNEQISRQSQIVHNGGRTVITRGNKVRITG